MDAVLGRRLCRRAASNRGRATVRHRSGRSSRPGDFSAISRRSTELRRYSVLSEPGSRIRDRATALGCRSTLRPAEPRRRPTAGLRAASIAFFASELALGPAFRCRRAASVEVVRSGRLARSQPLGELPQRKRRRPCRRGTRRASLHLRLRDPPGLACDLGATSAFWRPRGSERRILFRGRRPAFCRLDSALPSARRERPSTPASSALSFGVAAARCFRSSSVNRNRLMGRRVLGPPRS